MIRRPLIDRFMDKVSPEPNSGCWLWTGGLNLHGYGQIGRGGAGNGMVIASRASWMLFRGIIPPGMFVCHKCDVRSCVNPDHLFLGTAKENTTDALQKGRGVGRPRAPCRGEKHWKRKLTEDRVREIRESGADRQIVMAKYGISETTYRDIRAGRTWKHVNGS